MKPLPDWLSDGMVVGIVGGQSEVEQTYTRLKSFGIKMSGIWMQDWVGQHRYPEGTRLLWNWRLNRSHYPEWDQALWLKDGVRPILYLNPYLADFKELGLDNDLFNEALEQDLFVKNQEKETYLIHSVSIKIGLLDFTNPKAKEFAKRIIREHVLREAGAGGWMHDFGEYLPFDAVLHDGSDPFEYHSRYVEDWAQIAQEVIQEEGLQDDTFYFMRAGTARSPRWTSTFWMGDQLPTFDRHDGLHSALIGMLNGGLSGFTHSHSDIGAYTNTKTEGKEWIRTDELLQRWIEMAAFSDTVMRSHPSNMPEVPQLWTNGETLAQLKKFVDIHVALKPYKQMLMKEA